MVSLTMIAQEQELHLFVSKQVPGRIPERAKHLTIKYITVLHFIWEECQLSAKKHPSTEIWVR